MADSDDATYQRLLSNAWELRQTITKLTTSLQDPSYNRNDKEDLEIARKAAVAAVRDLHGDLERMGLKAPFFTWNLVDQPRNPAPAREPLRSEVF